MFSQASVIPSVHRGGGMCMVGGMHGRGHTWQGANMAGAYMAGCVCSGGHAWQRTCVTRGGMHGRGMCGKGECAW